MRLTVTRYSLLLADLLRWHTIDTKQVQTFRMRLNTTIPVRPTVTGRTAAPAVLFAKFQSGPAPYME